MWRAHCVPGWFVSGFSDLYAPLESVDRASPFTWYQVPILSTDGIGAGQLWLAATAVVLITAAALMFRRRDLSTERALLARLRDPSTCPSAEEPLGPGRPGC